MEPARPAEQRASDALDRFFATLHANCPVDATFMGHHDGDHRLPDWSPAGHTRAIQAWQDARESLRTARGSLDDTAIVRSGDLTLIDVAVAESHCDLTLAELQGGHMHRCNPALVTGEAAFSIIGLITRDFAPAAARASCVLQRLRGMPAFMAGALMSMRETPIPATWTERALRECDAIERLLQQGLPIWCREMRFDEPRTLAVAEAARFAAGGVAAFAMALRELPQGATRVQPCGEAFLQRCLARGHWVPDSVAELWTAARNLLEHEQERLAHLVQQAGAPDLGAVQERLAQNHPAPDAYYQAFQHTWSACHAHMDALGALSWPDSPVRYVPIPTWTRMAAPSLYYLYYRSPAPGDDLPDTEYVVPAIDALAGDALTAHLRAWNHSVIKLNHVVHHGALGHHVQNWWARRSPSRIGRVAAVDCASRIAMLQGGTMAEGWACYATDLADETGFLTPDERIAEQHSRVRMMIRAVTDLGFHSGRMNEADAMALHRTAAGASAAVAEAEVVKMSMFPGTASMYWLGTDGIHAIRLRESRRLGAGFALGAFHDRLLQWGSLPVAVIGALMSRSDVVDEMTPGETG